jgi:hypothetical protein
MMRRRRKEERGSEGIYTETGVLELEFEIDSEDFEIWLGGRYVITLFRNNA